MTTTPRIALVILNWNGRNLFSEFLPSVLRHTETDGVTIYVADNGSTDGSVEFLSEHFPTVKIIQNGGNYGFSKGYNLALEKIPDADIFVLVNSDVEVTENWLGPCIALLSGNPKLAAVQPKILSYRDKEQFEYAGAAGGYIDYLGYPFCRGRILNETETDAGHYDQPASILWATGACLVIRADVFREAGGFDDDFFAHMEEIDLCWRLRNQGWEIGYVPESRVYHLGGATLSYQSPRKVFLNFRNNLWMLIKNLPPNRLFPILFIRMVLDGVAAIRFVISGEYQAFMAVIKAHVELYRNMGKFLRKRKTLLTKVTRSRHPEIYRGSMVYNFYLKKRKKFSEFNFHPPMMNH
jgi:GT2 family glycosyltransferase